MRLMRRFVPVVSMLVLVTGCGGLPDSYGEALKTASGPAAVTCSPADVTSVAGVLSITNPGGLPMEFRTVEFPDASPRPTEVYVVSIPTDKTIGFGISSLDELDGGSGALAAAWEARSTLPAVVPPGSNGELLVVLDPPTDPGATNYVNQVELTLAVGDDSDSAEFTSLRMTGSDAACEATSALLEGDD